MTVEQAQASLDKFCALRGDTRLRPTADGRSSVATVAAAEPLRAMPPSPYPLIVSEDRTASRQALVSYRGNRYSVPPELAAAQVQVTRPLDSDFIDVTTVSGITVARHRLAADGTGAVVRDLSHVHALEQVAMAGADAGRPHRRKERIPPGLDALAGGTSVARQRNQQHDRRRRQS